MASHHILFPDYSSANLFHATGDIALSETPAVSFLKYFVFYLSIPESDSLSYPDTISDSRIFITRITININRKKNFVDSFYEVISRGSIFSPINPYAANVNKMVDSYQC